MERLGRLAFSHPGKLGDALYTLPTIKHICENYNTTCDFFTSDYCKPLIRLFEYQPYIDKVIIPADYKIERMDIGVQPWLMPIPDGYKTVYQLGFKGVPDKSIHQYIAQSMGLNINLRVEYTYPEFGTHDKPYIVIAPRGETGFKGLFEEVIEGSPIDTVVIGGHGDLVGSPTIDLTGLDMLETVTWLSKSRGFIGLMSSQLALANGFNYPKVAPHNGKSWDMRHVVYNYTNYYPVNPTAREVLDLVLKDVVTYSKTLDVADYNLMSEHIHIQNIKNLIGVGLFANDHPHRMWEYGLVLNALRKVNVVSILDVGGNGSAFAPSAAWLDMDVLQVDPAASGNLVAQQSAKISKPLSYLQKDFLEYDTDRSFDAVVCLSVLEHIPDDVAFFKKLLSFVRVGGLFAITVDFHPSGVGMHQGHHRTYNEQAMQEFLRIAREGGFELFGEGCDYTYRGEDVYTYTFASLVLKKER